jgi:hypothetical protein
MGNKIKYDINLSWRWLWTVFDFVKLGKFKQGLEGYTNPHVQCKLDKREIYQLTSSFNKAPPSLSASLDYNI